MAERRVVTIEHVGTEADFKIALGIIMRRLMRGERQGSEAGHWTFVVEEPPQKE